MFKTQSFLQFDSFRAFDKLCHFSTTRNGGCSTGTFASFNLGNYSGDTKEHIDTNRNTLCRLLNLSPDRLFIPHQVHGIEILAIRQDFLDTAKEQQMDMLEGKDALLTSCKNVCVAVSTADCVPILLYASDQQVVGALHAGWRGTCGRITQKVVRKIIDDYGCDPTKIYAIIGPSIGQEAFEVGEEVFHAFRDNGFDMKTIAYIHRFTGKYHIDLWEANREQLTTLGIPNRQIEIAGICTYQHSDIFFSARKLGIESGRMLTGIWLME